MFEYIGEVLHRDLEYSSYEKNEGLPLYITGAYDLYNLSIGNNDMLAAVPRTEINLSALRKQHRRIEALTGIHCVLYLSNMTYYARNKMIEEGIPFVWEGRQVYIPFLGMVLSSDSRTELPYCTKISFLTQKLLLTAIYQQWEKVNVTTAAEVLGVSKMSASRCFDEIEAFGIRQLDVKGRSRYLSCGDKKAFWEDIQSILIDPVINSYALRQDLKGDHALSGISALAGYSMLADDPFPTYGFTKKDIGSIDISRTSLIPPGEIPGCMVQKVGYWIEFGDGTKMDPLSVALSISEEDKRDPRVEQAIEEMLEEYVW